MISSKNYPMKSGLCEKKSSYILSVHLPEIEQEDISMDTKNGFLVLSASKKLEENDFVETYQRRFYIGHSITKADIKSTYRRNVLKIYIPKELNNKAKSIAFA